MCVCVCVCVCVIHTDRQAGRQAGRQTDRQTDRHTHTHVCVKKQNIYLQDLDGVGYDEGCFCLADVDYVGKCYHLLLLCRALLLLLYNIQYLLLVSLLLLYNLQFGCCY